jgi:diguanylate cyclase (GGDEF)-like protein/PAS domain S-box-containing protein
VHDAALRDHQGPLATPSAELFLEIAGVGGWELELEGGRARFLRWSRLTKAIHEVGEDFVPTLETALAFYPPEARAVLEPAIAAAIDTGAPWDLELPFVTARGRPIWVRARGRVVERNGARVRLAGTFEDITARRQKALEHERLALVVSQMTNAAILTDAEGRTVWVNDAFVSLTSYTLEDLAGRKPGEVLQGPRTDRAEVARISAALRAAERVEAELLNYRRDGTPYWIGMTITPVRDASGALTGFIAIETDVTARRAAEAEAAAEMHCRREAEALLRDVLDAIPCGVIAYNREDRFLLANRAYAALYPELVPHLVRGRALTEILWAGVEAGLYVRELPADAPAEEKRAWVERRAAEIRSARRSRVFQTADGRWLQGREGRSPSGNLVCVRTDITRLKRAEEEITLRAETDPLTGLANRTVLFARLAHAFETRRARDRGGLLVIFDLDHFKDINDSLGHQAGDTLLRKLGRRLGAAVRAEDTAARLGGDEFALILPGLVSLAEAERFLARLVARLSRAMTLSGHKIAPALSLGCAFYPGDAGSPEELYRAADAALYEAKRQGRGRWTFFDRALEAETRRRRTLSEALRRALEEERIEIALQPQVRLADGGHVGFEALVRWSRDGVPVPPSEFVPIAEETGLIVLLGSRVLRAALAAIGAMLARGLEPGRLAVNVSSPQLTDPGFVRMVKRLCREARVSPARLEIEVTETVLLDRSAARIAEVLAELRALGATIALDDFGTGYASLAHLQRFPVQRLKIDKSFIAAIDRDGREAKIAATVIGLARGLGMEAVAEGVETARQRDWLEAQGCAIGQGYFFAPPLSVEAAAEALARRWTPGPRAAVVPLPRLRRRAAAHRAAGTV